MSPLDGLTGLSRVRIFIPFAEELGLLLVYTVVPAAGYIKAQAYVALVASHSAHYIDPALRAVLESAYTPDDNDLFLSNLAHHPILAVHG